MYFEDLKKPYNLEAHDIIITIMGPTGAGKSNIIDLVTGENKRVGHELESCTKEIDGIRIRGHPKYRDRIVLIDTPGFDDTHKTDFEILQIICEWLSLQSKAQVFLSGIIYLHRITDVRMSGAHQITLRMFSELCGRNFVEQVVLVTTMWDCETKELGERREKEIMDYYWKTILKQGACTARFHNTEKSAWEIINKLLDKPVRPMALQLQGEMVNPRRHLKDTKAVQALYIPPHNILAHPCTIQEKLDHQKAQEAGQLKSNDIIIALMGPSGSGKSHIIDILTERSNQPAPTSLHSSTAEVRSFRIRNHSRYRDRIVLVDTPSFDNSNVSDIEILRLISDWLAKTYEEKILLSGIVYLHRITDNRMSGTPHRNLRLFGGLCGNKASKNVVIVTTMWDRLKSIELGIDREKFLQKRFWSAMLEHGSTMARFDNEPTSAWDIINSVISRRFKRVPLLLQEEVIDYDRCLNETYAGRELYDNLQTLLAQQKETIQILTEQANAESDPMLAADLVDECFDIQQQLKAALEQVKMLQISTSRKIMLFLNRPTTRPLDLG